MNYKVIKTIAAASALLLTLGACQEKPETLPPSITADESLNITGDAGSHSLTFTIENYVQDVAAEAVSDAEWLTIDNVVQGTEASVEFTVTANDGITREANINISYGSATSVAVKVRQYPQGADMESPFLIEVGALAPYSCTITYTPINYTGNYYFLVMGAEDFERYLNNDNMEGLLAADLEWLEYQADYNGLTLEEFLPRAKQIYAVDGATTSMSYSDLEKETEYYAYCYGLSVSGEVQTDVVYKKFKTEIVETVDMSFDGEATDITRNSATITVRPSTNEHTYYWTYVSEMDMANYDLETIMNNMILNLQAIADETGTPLSQLLCKGENTASASDLWAGTEYSIVAWGMDEAGTPTTKPQVAFTFDTPSDEITDDCTFEVEFPEVKPMDILVHVTPSNPETRYYVAVIESSICTGYNDEQMAQRIINMEAERIASDFYGPDVTWENFESLYSGEQTLWAQEDLYWTFKPETLYQVYVFGVNNNGERTTAVKRLDQMTAPAEESAMTFQVDLAASSWRYATFHITPSNEDEYWLPFLISSEALEYYRNADGSLDEKTLVEYIEHYYDNSVAYYLVKGEASEYTVSWISEMNYTLLLCGWAGSNTTEFYEFEFTSPAIPFGQSTAEVSATYELFDGADLYELDPIRWEGYQEDCVMYIQFDPNEDAVHWYGGVWAPVANYADVGGVHQLLILDMIPETSFVDQETGIIRPWWDSQWSFSYVAEGADGTFGEWHYEEFSPVKGGDNISEAYDFWSNPAQNSVIMNIPKDYNEQAESRLIQQSKSMIRNDVPAVIPQNNFVENPNARTISAGISAERMVMNSVHNWKTGIEERVIMDNSSSERHHTGYCVKNTNF